MLVNEFDGAQDPASRCVRLPSLEDRLTQPTSVLYVLHASDDQLGHGCLIDSAFTSPTIARQLHIPREPKLKQCVSRYNRRQLQLTSAIRQLKMTP